jgi:hypothetical protein
MGVRVFGSWCHFQLVGGGGGYRPYFENYTVDASILDSTERSDHINNNNFLQHLCCGEFIGQSQHFGVAIDSYTHVISIF